MPQRLCDLVQATTDPGMLKYAIQNLGKGVPPGSKNWPLLFQLHRVMMSRYLQVCRLLSDPRTRNKLVSMMSRLQQDKMRRRLQTATWQLRYDLQQLARMESMAQFELFLRQLAYQGTLLVAGKLKRLQDLAQEKPYVVREKLNDRDAETRWMATQIVAIKRYHFESKLISLLDDPVKDVRRGARQALVRLSRGCDFGPALSANRTEREQAQKRWQAWWAVQDNNPKRRPRVAKE